MFDNGILNDIIYGDLPDESCFKTLLQHEYTKQRKEKFTYKRIDMDYHFNMCRQTNGFQCRYHMTEKSYHHLVNILYCDIAPNEQQSRKSTSGNDPVTAQMVTCMGLRFMGGEKIKTLADAYGVSTRHTDTAVELFLKAVDESSNPLLSSDLLPKTTAEKIKLANDWNNCSGGLGIMYGHLAPIDGWLCTTQMPADVPNPSEYFSGHYQRFGLNVQAMCDSNLRIIYTSVAGPGKMNDARAFRKLKYLQQWLEQLDDQFFCSGDNAYPLSNNMLIPFSGTSRHDEHNLTYNFYLSQLRIRVEMAFGRLTTKWRIFRTDLNCSNEKNCMIIRVGIKLHNYVINSDDLKLNRYDCNNYRDLGVEPLDDGPQGNRGYLPSSSRPVASSNQNNSIRRSNIVNMIKERDIVRPLHNIERNG